MVNGRKEGKAHEGHMNKDNAWGGLNMVDEGRARQGRVMGKNEDNCN